VGKFQIETTEQLLKDYHCWAETSPRTLLKIEKLMLAIEADPFKGIGKPEPLRYQLSGSWSRRINEEHRLIYRLAEGTITFLSCHGHYK
jgi:toxin YoeB